MLSYSIAGVLTVVPPADAAPVTQLSITALNDLTKELTSLSSEQRNHLEYIILLWLTGTPRRLTDMYQIKGEPLLS